MEMRDCNIVDFLARRVVLRILDKSDVQASKSRNKFIGSHSRGCSNGSSAFFFEGSLKFFSSSSPARRAPPKATDSDRWRPRSLVQVVKSREQDETQS